MTKAAKPDDDEATKQLLKDKTKMVKRQTAAIKNYVTRFAG